MNRKRILLVANDPVFLRAMAGRLSTEGFEVLVAHDASEAAATLRRLPADLILLDIDFPPDVAHGGGASWDGFSIIDWFRRMGVGAPVILVAATDLAPYVQRARKSGAAGLFPKTLDPGEWIGPINRLVHKSTVPAVPAP